MRIGDLSRRTGISTSRIRFYERHDVLPKPIRRGNGYRSYPDATVKILHLIDDAQRLGFSLSNSRRPQRSRAQFSVALGNGQSFAKQARRHRPAYERRAGSAAKDRETAQGNGRLSAASAADEAAP